MHLVRFALQPYEQQGHASAPRCVLRREPAALMLRTEVGGALPDVESCSAEPIHIIGHIQSNGLLFALSQPDFIVRQVSANVKELSGIPAPVALNRSLEALLGSKQFDVFRSRVANDDLLATDPLRVVVGERALAMNCIAHRQDGELIAEFELLHGAHTLNPLNLTLHVQIPLSRMEQATDIRDLSRIAAGEIQRLSGFDRVMVYRFDADWNGEVIAEATSASPVSYLGLRFPASDIPAQARRLFLINPMRTIADVTSAPVPIVPELGPHTQRPLDLTHAFLRSPSPVHTQYLRNMNVGGSMTISIVVRGRLWGMIACHSTAPRAVDCSIRSVCELIGRILASQIALQIEKSALQARLASRQELEAYMAGVEASTALFDGQPFQSARLLDLFHADGFVCRINEVVTSQGSTVDETALRPVIGKLQRFAARGIASSNLLGVLDRAAQTYAAKVSGAMYIGLTESPGDYLLLLRRELVETVNWAGDPDKAVSASADGALRPRTSFAAWQETVRGRSRPWSELELESARFLREQLLKLRVAYLLGKSEQRIGQVPTPVNE